MNQAIQIVGLKYNKNLQVVYVNELITGMSWSLDQNPDPAIYK